MDTIDVGQVGRPYGVKGWVHVRSDMAPPDALLEHDAWVLRGPGPNCEARCWSVTSARRHGSGLVAFLEGCADREQADRLRGAHIALPREVLPEPEPDEYYWVDLIGLEAVVTDGSVLGRVARLLETGTHDVLVIHGEREHLVPFVPRTVVTEVDLEAGRLRLDWDPDWDPDRDTNRAVDQIGHPDREPERPG